MNIENLEKKALAAIEAQKHELFQMLSKLIQFDTQNFISHGNEKLCAEYLLEQYKAIDLESELFYPDQLPGFSEHPDYLPGRGTDKRPNVRAVWEGTEACVSNQVMFAAHTDTMPIGDETLWEENPFGGVIKNGRIFGLGAGDNKAGLAAAYFAVKTLQSCQIRLKKSVVLSAYCDEEYGGGNGALAACLRDPCETHVNLDGGNYELWSIALGGGGFEINLHKTNTTDSLLDCYLATEALMAELKTFAADRRAELHQIPLYLGSDMERSAFRLSHLGNQKKGHTDMSLGFVIYTDKDVHTIEAELETILERLNPLFQSLHIVTDGFRKNTRFFHYCETDKSNGAAMLMKRSAEETAGRAVLEKGSCLTDLSLFLKYGSPHSFNFGILRDFALPGGAHQPNEFVDCEEFLHYTQALILFLMRYCGISEERSIQ